MLGTDRETGAVFSYVSLEERVPQDHPLRAMRRLVDEALRALSPRFDRLYAKRVGRPSLPPERLLRGEIHQAFFDAIVEQADALGLLSQEHFTVDGTLIEAWASQKSFRPKDEGDGPPG